MQDVVVAETGPQEELQHSPDAAPELPELPELWEEPQYSPDAEPSSPESPELGEEPQHSPAAEPEVDGAPAALAVLEDTAATLTQQLPLEGSVTRSQVSCVAPIQVLCST